MHDLQHREHSEFFSSFEPDLFAKADHFDRYRRRLHDAGLLRVLVRLELLGPVDRRIAVRSPLTGEPTELVCFDSNSYLGLHLHPRVRAVVHEAVDEMGVGTASAQVLCGHNHHLAALETHLGEFLGREGCVVFPSGYQANLGVLTGLLRRSDLVVVDAHCHPSVHDGARFSGARVAPYRHRDLEHAERVLNTLRGDAHSALLVTDGVFGLEGDLADLPGLLELARRHEARLLVNDAHGIGVLGDTGRGLEELQDCRGGADILVGTFATALGAVGGYVCGSTSMTNYVRYFARPSLFRASPPAAWSAAITESLRVIDEEPEHRERLWSRARALHAGLDEVGVELPELTSPIVPLHVGDERKLPRLAHDMLEAGLKVGFAQYPAVPHGGALMRLAANARHTEADVDLAVNTLADLGHRHGLLVT